MSNLFPPSANLRWFGVSLGGQERAQRLALHLRVAGYGGPPEAAAGVSGSIFAPSYVQSRL